MQNEHFYLLGPQWFPLVPKVLKSNMTVVSSPLQIIPNGLELPSQTARSHKRLPRLLAFIYLVFLSWCTYMLSQDTSRGSQGSIGSVHITQTLPRFILQQCTTKTHSTW